MCQNDSFLYFMCHFWAAFYILSVNPTSFYTLCVTKSHKMTDKSDPFVPFYTLCITHFICYVSNDILHLKNGALY